MLFLDLPKIAQITWRFTWTFHIFLFIYNRNTPTQHWPLISIRTCGHKTLVYEFCDRTRKNQERQTRTLPILYIHCSDWTTLEYQYKTGTWMLYSLPLIGETSGASTNLLSHGCNTVCDMCLHLTFLRPKWQFPQYCTM